MADLALATNQPITALLEAPPEVVKAIRAAHNERVKEANRRARRSNLR